MAVPITDLGLIRKEKERLVDQLTQELYLESNRCFRPLYPWVFVRVLQKEYETRSGLVLPATDQHKTVYEGIVIATWKPFTQERGGRIADNDLLLAGQGKLTGVKFTRMIMKRSQFELGERVLFPHWSGLPIPGFDSKLYRVVREEEFDLTKDGGIVARVDYDEQDTRPGAVLRELLNYALEHDSKRSDPDMDRIGNLIAAKLEERFLLVDRQAKSVTLSGV